MAYPELVFYDIKSLIPGRSLSQNTWRARELAYETVWVEGDEIAATCIAAGIPPLEENEDGSPHYTLPALIDNTNPDAPVRLCDSRKIIDYLEKAYPSPNPQRVLFPPGTRGLQKLADAYFSETIIPLVMALLAPAAVHKLPERVRHVVERIIAPPGKTLADLELRGKDREEAWGKLRAALDKLGEYAEGEIFFTGDELCYFDIHVLSILTSMRLVFGDKEFEKEVGPSAGGRWVKLVNACAKLIR